ncbi:MAG: urease accessory protein UreD [Rubrobacteraceae bacterium]
MLEASSNAAYAVQRGSLRLAFDLRRDRTVLADRHASTPFGAVRAGYPDASGMAEVQVTNPAGGVLGGDRLDITATLAPGSAATILTQGATKVYKGEEARQEALFDVGKSALLEYLPHHLIPYAGSSYRQTTEFRLAEGATLIAWDACSPGRVARGERFDFDNLSNRTKIFRCGMPQVMDGFELSGGGEPFGSYSYVGTLYLISASDLSPLAEKLHGTVNSLPGALASASVPSPNLCVMRTMTRNAPALYRMLNDCRATTRSFLDLPAPPRQVW